MYTNKLLIAVFSLALVSIVTAPSTLFADPCLIVYPSSPAKYHYDVNEYYTVGFAHPLYNPLYDRGGQVLIDSQSDEIAYNIYQTPDLTGFQPSSNGEEGYFFLGSGFDLIIDGFNNQPTTYENIILVFDSDPAWCVPQIVVNGQAVTGTTFAVGDLIVGTPTAEGNNYSDTLVKSITWSGCYGLRMWAFSDINYNGVRDGGECFTAFSHDASVPTVDTSWGAVKNLYKQ
ncbi:MAG: hypothetical protein ABIA59_02725 [Candidatus Latescibacterota bacterium]